MLRLHSKILMGLIFLMGYCINVQAQEECELVLTRATEEFNAGHFYSIPAMLKDCLDKHQTREWRQRAHLLLAETYLLLEDPVGAEKSYLEVLQANPEYVTDASRDPIDLVYLSSKFTATPIFTLFGKLGLNTSVIRPILYRNMYSREEKYKLRPGFHIGGGLDWNYDENLSATAGATFVFTSYKYESSNVFTRDNIDLVDKQSWLTIPLSVKYTASEGKYRPYGYAGFSLDWMLGDKAALTYSDKNIKPNPDPNAPVEIQAEEKESPIFKFNPKRNTWNSSFFVGGGVKYKLGLRYAFVDVRYSFGLTNVVNTDNSVFDYGEKDRTSAGFLDSGEATFNWAHIDNLFRMDNLYVSIGYAYPLYNPRKLKKTRSKSVLRKIKKQSDEVTPD